MSPAAPHGIPPTRLEAPRVRPGAVLRPRLLDQLDGALWQSASLVSAPAGFGKSTLVAQWLEIHSHPHAWLTVEPSDNRPLGLLRGLLAMLAPHFPELADAVLPPGGSLVDLLGVWIIPRLAALREPFVIVLDDAHHLTDADALHALGWLIERLPGPCHFVIASRGRPELPLARLQVRGQLTIVDGRALRFSLDESRRFYTQTMALELTDDEVSALEARTEGWAAAIQLSALSVRAGVDPLDLARTARPDRALEQFLTEEVLARQAPHVRRFLLRTSILRRMSVAACEAVTGEGAREALALLERENLFLVPLDAQGRWWRYHHLFSSLLGSVLERSDEPIPELHRSACNWAC
ncbi:MAG: helix-turn-helix transcriptional regulator, partial [Myxococcota bacterium]